MLSLRDRAELAAYNYFINGGGESGTTGLQAFNTTFSGGVPGTITLGSTLVAINTVTTNVLSGNASTQLACTTAAGSAGHGWISDVMTLGDADLAKIIALSCDYNFVAGNANVNVSGLDASQTVQIWIYNVGSSSWIQPAGYNSINTNGTSGQFVPGRTPNITFQSGISNASNNNQYRFAFIIRNAPAGVFSLNVDNIYFGRQLAVSSSAAVTDWVAFTPTLAGYTATSNVGYWRRVGDSMEVHIDAVLSSALTGAMNVYLPAGYTYDSAKANAMCGLAAASHSSGVLVNGACTPDAGGTYVRTYGGGSGTNGRWTSTVPFTWASTDEISVNFTVPIIGWSSNCVMSQDTDTRVVAAKYNTSTQTVTTTYVPLIATSKEFDTHGCYSASTGQYTVAVPGLYRVSAELQGATTSSAAVNQNAIAAIARKNGSFASVLCGFTFQVTGVNIAPIANGYALVQCNAGDVLDVAIGHDANVTNYALLTGATQNWVSFERLSGPSAIAANESVNAKYNSSSTAVGTANSAMVCTVKEFDSHSAYNTSTGIYTVPVSGKYRISGGFASLSAVSSSSGDQYVILSVGKNSTSTATSRIGTFGYATTGLTVTPNYAGGSTEIQCIAGDTLAVLILRNAAISAFSLDGGSATNWVCFEKVGN